MPNAVGGSQSHPAYDPLAKLASNEVLIGNDLYQIKLKERVVVVENVSGRIRARPFGSNLPTRVKNKIRRMEEAEKK